MPSATDYKARLVEALEHTLTTGVSLDKVLAEEVFAVVEVKRLGNLVIQIKVDWDPKRPPRYYTIKLSEPW